mgnify:CR=1 FL=1
MTQVPNALVADLGRAKRIDQLLAAIDEHDHYTGGHSCRVAAQAGLLARLIGLDDRTVERVKAAGLVHDIGKVHIQRHILRKRSELTECELAQMKMHPITGAAMLSYIPGMEELAPIVLHHHERWDGQGYPTGVSGIDIPLESRIIFVADAFDAMTTARSYGDIVGTRLAIEEIDRCAGWQFDPSVAHAIKLAYDKKWLEPNGIEDRIPAVDIPRHPY